MVFLSFVLFAFQDMQLITYGQMTACAYFGMGISEGYGVDSFVQGPKFSDISKMMQIEHVVALSSLIASIQRCRGLWRLQEVMALVS